MLVLGPRQQAAIAELAEWWEDQWQRGIGPRVLLVKVPSRWGRSTVLDEFEKTVSSADDPVTLVVRINGLGLPGGLDLQAETLSELLTDPAARSRVAVLLGLDNPAGGVQLGLGAAGLLVSGPAALLVFLASLAAGATGKLWEDSSGRPGSVVARSARSVAEVSRSVPVVVLIDDAHLLDTDLALKLLENLAFRADGQMLAVVVLDPGSELAKVLAAGNRYGLAGMVYTADADPDMGYQSRVRLARELCPGLPEAGSRRIGQRTQTFAEVFTVATAGILAEARPGDDRAGVVAAVDALVDASRTDGPPSAEATIVAWAEGDVHVRQVVAALAIWKAEAYERDADLIRTDCLVRLSDPSSHRLNAAGRTVAPTLRQAMAETFLDEALGMYADPLVPLIDRIVAGQAAHRVRRYLDVHGRERLVQVQREVVSCLERAGDLAAAALIADEALAELPVDDQEKQAVDELAAAKLRLARISPLHEEDPLVAELLAEALSGGAALGLEAKVWAAISLLDMPGHREAALQLTDQVAEYLESHADLGSAAVSWRLLLAFHAGRAGYPAGTQRLLDPLLTSTDISLQDAATAVLRAGAGPQADVRLGIALLEAELRAGASEDDSLRLHNALGSGYERLGDYRRALSHTEQELQLRQRLQGEAHPATLATWHDHARRTGHAGDAARARDELATFMPDFERVFGPEHPRTMTARHDHAWWTGRAGDTPRARDLYADMLPSFKRIFGSQHPDTLTTLHNHATYTKEAGESARARDQLAALLPDYTRVFGAENLGTLTARLNLALCTGDAGEPALARDQLAELLPDVERILGAGHPQTLVTRLQCAFFTGEAGDVVSGRDQTAALLPDLERILGKGHPDTFAASLNLAYFTWKLDDDKHAS